MQVLVIGLGGPAGSGKDTAMALIKAMADRTASVRVARFAEPIYDMVRTLVPGAYSGMSSYQKDREREALGGISIRQAMVAMGQGISAVKPDAFTCLWDSRVRNLAQNPGPLPLVIVCPDLRKEVEREGLRHVVEALKGLGLQVQGLIVHIRAPEREASGAADAATETPLELDSSEAHPELEVFNFHSRGLASLALALVTALADTPGVKTFIDPKHSQVEEYLESARRAHQEEKEHWSWLSARQGGS